MLEKNINLEEHLFYRLVNVTYFAALLFLFLVIGLFTYDSFLLMITVWAIVYIALSLIKEALLYIAFGKKFSWGWLHISYLKSNISDASPHPYKTTPFLAAAVVADLFLQKKEPFPKPKNSSSVTLDIEDIIICTTIGYSFYSYLLLLRKKFGKEIACIIRQYIIIILNRIDNLGDTVEPCFLIIEQAMPDLDPYFLYNNLSNPNKLKCWAAGTDKFEEYTLALYILVNMEGSPYYVSPNDRKDLTPENCCFPPDDAIQSIVKCLIQTKNSSLEIFEPFVNSINFTSESILGLNSEPELIWSSTPSCFENHLRRMWNNVVFPPEKRIISQDQIDEARAKDLNDLNKLRQNLNLFLQAIPEELGFDVATEMNELREQIENLIKRAYEIGGEALNIVDPLNELRNNTIETWRIGVGYDKEALAKLEEAEVFHSSKSVQYCNPFIMQFIRDDSPFKNEIAESLMTENQETLKACRVILFEDTLANEFRKEITNLINRVHARGEEIPLLKDKLSAIGIDIPSL